MTDTSRSADAVATVRAVLLAAGISPVVTRTPNPRPVSFVQLKQTGGEANEVTANALISIDTWAGTEPEAGDLGRLVAAACCAAHHSTVGGVQIYGVEAIEDPADLPDPLSSGERCRQLISITTRTIPYP